MKRVPRRAAIGVDIGATKMRFALVDERFRVVEETKASTPARGGFEEVLEGSIAALVRKARKRSLLVVAAGAGCSGAVDRRTGTVIECLNIPYLKRYPLARRLARLAGAPAVAGNDVHLGLYGEHQLGAAVGLRHVLALFVGSGAGGALLIDGQVHLGANGRAGNIGRLPLAPRSQAVAEESSMLDGLISRPALASQAAAIAAMRRAPKLRRLAGADVRAMRSSMLAQAAGAEPEIEAMIRKRVRLAGLALAGLVDFLNPELILLGGGVVESMPKLVPRELERGLRDALTPAAAKPLRIAVAGLGDHAVTVGAAKAAVDRLAERASGPWRTPAGP